MEEDSKVIVDPEQLRRVINNIVSNSIKYTDKPKVKITMDVKDVGDFIQVELGDNGKGIAAKDLPNIFVSTGQMLQGILPREEAASVFLS